MPGIAIPPLPHRAQSISVRLAAHLERLIAIGELAPGSRLPAERDLAATLAVSRASLREAMHELESKNLIERRPGRGTIVVERSSEVRSLLELAGGTAEQDNAAELRRLVEPSVAGLAAERATPSNLLQLQEVLDRTRPDLRPQRSLECDIEFHLLLAHAARNPLITTLHTLMTDWTMDVRRHSHSTKEGRRTSGVGHRAIYEAVAAHDAAAARAAMERHLDEVHDLITRIAD